MWVPPETKDPVLLHQPTRKSVGYSMERSRLRDGRFFFRQETSKFNALTCWGVLAGAFVPVALARLDERWW